MFKNASLGRKLGAGFSLLLAVTIALGAIAVVAMANVRAQARAMAREYAPEVRIAAQSRGATLTTMYHARGYGLSGDEQMLANGKQSLDKLDALLGEGDALVKEASSLTNLRERLPKAHEQSGAYRKLLSETEQQQAIEAAHTALNTSAMAFMDGCQGWLTAQHTKMNESLAKGGEAIVDIRERNEKLAWMNEVIDAGYRLRVAAWKAQVERDAEIAKKELPRFDTIKGRLNQILGITHQAVNRQRINAALKAADAYKQALQDTLDAMAQLGQLAKQRETTGDRLIAEIVTIVEGGLKNLVGKAELSHRSLTRATRTLLIGLVVALVLGVGLSLFLTRNITDSVITPVRKVIGGLNASSGQVTSASAQVAQASQVMASGASEQASSLEETSASLTELASMTQQNAANARHMHELSSTAQTAAEHGDEAVGRMNQAIDRIRTSSNETAKVLKTIDEIAFQTNLLALNAAVEAARAGEAGKGFAVVAEEVRNLAQRSAEAARQTASMIERSQQDAQSGVDTSAEVAGVLKQLTESARKVVDLAGQVATASEEQARGVDQISTAVSQMDQVTQSNAANAEEAASASEELSAQARELNDMIGMLAGLVGGGGTSGSAPAKSAPADWGADTTDWGNGSTGAAVHSPRVAANGKRSSEPVVALSHDDFKDF